MPGNMLFYHSLCNMPLVRCIPALFRPLRPLFANLSKISPSQHTVAGGYLSQFNIRAQDITYRNTAFNE